MSEKLYHEIRDGHGIVHISHSVIAEIVSIACLEVEGVASMALATAGTESGVKGVSFTLAEDGGCTVDAHILAKMGCPLAEVAKNVQQAIKNAVESGSGLAVTAVNVFVAGVSLK